MFHSSPVCSMPNAAPGFCCASIKQKQYRCIVPNIFYLNEIMSEQSEQFIVYLQNCITYLLYREIKRLLYTHFNISNNFNIWNNYLCIVFNKMCKSSMRFFCGSILRNAASDRKSTSFTTFDLITHVWISIFTCVT